jgi:tight adherence protein B
VIALVLMWSMLFVAGVALAVVPPTSAPAPPVDPQRLRRFGSRSSGAVALALIVTVVSGWLLAGLAVAVGAFWAIGGWQRRQRSSDAEIARLDALASWVESVRDVLMAGEQPVGAITSTVSACPPVIRPHVRRLAAGLGRQDPEIVFRRFADDIDDPVADLVAAGLAIAIRRGARTVPVLTALAEQTREQVDRRRLIEAERAPTRREVQSLTAVMVALVIGLLVFGRSEYLDAYDSATGQLFLALALLAYAALIVRVQRLAAFPRPGRFLTGTSTGAAAGAGVARTGASR